MGASTGGGTCAGKLPWANHAYAYDFQEGESGDLVLEFWITPFDYAPYEGPARAAISDLKENHLIALSWAILDYIDMGRDCRQLLGQKSSKRISEMYSINSNDVVGHPHWS